MSIPKRYWIGGSPCAGKSAIAELLARRYDVDVYRIDDALRAQIRRLSPEEQPALWRWMQASWDERWMKPVGELVQEVVACYTEHFSLILEDLDSCSTDRRLLVEGSALLPRLVRTVIGSSSEAIWIVPTPEFQTTMYAKRSWIPDILAQCRKPDIAFGNWMARDAQFANIVIAETRALGLQMLITDGQRSIDDQAKRVVSWFGWT